MRKLENLVTDIYAVIEDTGGWDATITKFFREELSRIAEARFSETKERNYLSASNLGTPCKRKLWYRINQPELAEPLNAEALGTFFYGDMIEVLLLSLAKAAGHTVEGEQDEIEVCGIKGHRDAVIDGVTVDIKSASSFGFSKFQKGALRDDDPFGYISQLSSYVYAGRDDPLVVDKSGGAFLVAKKDRFKLCLDYYDLSEELARKEQEVEEVKKAVKEPSVSCWERIPPVPVVKDPKKDNGNRKLALPCQYCEFKKTCWPEMRTFLYSTGPEHLVVVKKEPRALEIT